MRLLPSTRATLGKPLPFRLPVLKNLVSSLILHEQILTTRARAKAIRPIAELLIQNAKENKPDLRYEAEMWTVNHEKTLPLLYGPLRARYQDRPMGFTRMYHLPPREMDAVPMSVVEFINGPKDTLLLLEKYKDELASFKEQNSNLFTKEIHELMQAVAMPSEKGDSNMYFKKRRLEEKKVEKMLVKGGRYKMEYLMKLYALKASGQPIPEEHDEVLRCFKKVPMNLCLDERQCFHDDPYFRQSLRQSQEKLDVFNDLLFSLILKVKAYGQLNEDLNETSLEVVNQLSSINLLYEREPAISSTDAKYIYPCSDRQRDITSVFMTSLTTLTQHMAELNSERQKTLSNVYNQILNPLVEFHQHLETLSKITRKHYEKVSEEYEYALGRYLNRSRRKEVRRAPELAQAVLVSKKVSVEATYNYVQQLNSAHSRKELLLMEKMNQFFVLFPAAAPQLKSDIKSLLQFFRKQTTDTTDPIEMNGNVQGVPVTELFKGDFQRLKESLTMEVSAVPPCGILPSTKCGYLWKRMVKGPLKTWQRKYCWIEMPDGLLMHLPKSRGLSDPLKLSDLCDTQVSESEVDDRYFTFELLENGQSIVTLQAENEFEFREWLVAIRASQSGQGLHRTVEKPIPIRPRLQTNANMISTIETIPQPTSGSSLTSPSSSYKRMAIYDLIRSGSPVDSEPDADLIIRERTSSMANLSIHRHKKISNSTKEEVRSGFLSMKEVRQRDRSKNSYISQNRDYSNSLWRSAKFILQKDRKLYQWNEQASAGGRHQIDIVDIFNNVTSRCFIQPVDESLFQRKHVFLIATNDGRFIYFAALNQSDRLAWLTCLKQMAKTDTLGSIAGSPKYRLHRSLHLRIIEGRNLNVTFEPFCDIYFGLERKARTNAKLKCNGLPFWREDFLFEDHSPLRHGIDILVMNQNRTHRDTEIGRVHISSRAISVGELEAWYPIVNTDQNGTNLGDLKLKLVHNEEKVLPQKDYDCYQSLLNTPDTDLVYDLEHATSDLEYLAQILLHVYDAQGMAVPWLKRLMDEEVEKTDKMHVLFRGNSILTKAMDCFMKLCGMEYLEQTLGRTIKEIVDNKVYCEVDPTRLDKSEDVKIHWRRLNSYATVLLQNIQSSASSIPLELRILFHHLQRLVIKKYNCAREDKYIVVRYTSVSGFLFLRLFCPAILNPKLFGLCRDFADTRTSRTLTLLAKTLQCLSNMANFGVKEPFMIDMNSFIMDHSSHMMEFIDSIATEPEAPFQLPRRVCEVDREWSKLHRLVDAHVDSLEKLKEGYQHQMAEDPRRLEIKVRQLERLLQAHSQIEAKLHSL